MKREMKREMKRNPGKKIYMLGLAVCLILMGLQTVCLGEELQVKLSKETYVYDGNFHMPTVRITDQDGNPVDVKQFEIMQPKSAQAVGKYDIIVRKKDGSKSAETLSFQIIPKATQLKQVKSDESGLQVTWNQTKQTLSGFQLQYATDQKFRRNRRTLTIRNGKAVRKVIKKGETQETYYVRIRGYQNVKYNGKTIKLYSNWSKVKKIRMKS